MPDYPTLAVLDNEILRRYVVLAGIVFVGAGVLVAGLRLAGRDVDHAWSSLKGWLVMIPLVLGSLALGRVATIVFLTAVALAAFREYARATGLHRHLLFMGTVYLGIVAVGFSVWVEAPRLGVNGWYGLFMALPAYVMALILVLPILRNRAKGQLQLVALALMGFLYIGWMLSHLAFLANSPNAYGYILFLLFAVEINDVAAFTFGRLFGKHQLLSEISPNKTWEGALGAFAVAMALPWLLRFSFPDFGVTELVLAGLIVGVGGQLGDLSISTIKRDLDIKDMGRLIEGHGGVLDRVDSLIYTAPLFFHMVRWTRGIY